MGCRGVRLVVQGASCLLQTSDPGRGPNGIARCVGLRHTNSHFGPVFWSYMVPTMVRIAAGERHGSIATCCSVLWRIEGRVCCTTLLVVHVGPY